MGSFKLIDIILILGALQGFFLAFALPRISKANKEANKLLAILVFVASVLTSFYFVTRFFPFWPIQIDVFLDSLAFVFGPLMYLYIKKLLFSSNKKSGYILLHFLPAITHFLYGLYILQYSNEEFLALLSSGVIKKQWVFIFSTLVLLILGYWFASLKLLLEFKEQQKRVVSFKQNFRYVSVFLVGTLISYFVCIVFSLDFFFKVKLFSFTGINLGWVIVPFVIYYISYFAMIRPEILTVEYHSKNKNNPRIKIEKLDIYKRKLEEFMCKEKLYLNHSLTLNDLADRLNLSTTKVSWLINENYESNFYDFVNEYRIEAFIEKLKNNEHSNQTFIALAYDVGFNSKTTFNKSFKKNTNSTPSEYIKKLTLVHA